MMTTVTRYNSASSLSSLLSFAPGITGAAFTLANKEISAAGFLCAGLLASIVAAPVLGCLKSNKLATQVGVGISGTFVALCAAAQLVAQPYFIAENNAKEKANAQLVAFKTNCTSMNGRTVKTFDSENLCLRPDGKYVVLSSSRDVK